MRSISTVLGCACALISAQIAAAQSVPAPAPLEELLNTGATYDPAIPTPEEVIGFPVGARVTQYELIADYVQAVAAASDRLSVEVIGRSHEGRPIHLVTATSPANHDRIDEIRAGRAALLDPNASVDLDAQPVVAQLVFGVHGDETSGYDSALLMLYHLAAAQDDETLAILDESVLLLCITINPDGASRMAAWTNQNLAVTPVSDRRHRRTSPPWPAPRTNHYWFDLNRQWLPATQPESQAIVAQTVAWLPNIAADMHEMGSNSTFWFSPGPRAGLSPLITQESYDLSVTVGQTIAEQLDSEGRLYVSEEYFDDYYLGYGSSYPSLVGAAAFLFEQSSTDGGALVTDHGLETYDRSVAEQFSALYALVRSARANADALRTFQRDYFVENASGPNRGYVFASEDRGRLANFLELLNLHGVSARVLARDVAVDGRNFSAGEAYVVAANQALGPTVEGLFETRIVPEDAEWRQFYDVTGWTMPHAYGIDFARISGSAFAGNMAGEAVPALDIARPAPAQADYAYVVEWGQHFAPRAVYGLLEAGLRAYMLPEPAQMRTADGEIETGRGAVFVPVRNQTLSAEEIHAAISRAAQDDGVVVHAIASGYTPEGPDLGSFAIHQLEAPHVVLVVGDGVRPEAAGEMWFLLDHEMHHPVRLANLSDLDAAALEDATHLILPNGGYGDMPDGFADALRAWVQGGGVFIGIQGGAEWAVSNAITNVAMRGVRAQGEESDDAAPAPSAPPRLPYSDKGNYDAEEFVSGAVFVADIDATHPLGFGYESGRIHLHRQGRNAFEPTTNPFATIIAYDAEAPLISGYVSSSNIERLSGLGALVAERSGQGSVVLFADDPFFRAYWRGTAGLVMNAIYFGTAFEPPYRPGG